MNTKSKLGVLIASLLISSLASFGCHTPVASQKSSFDEEKLNAMAQEQYGDNYVLHYDADKSFVAVCNSTKRHEQDPLLELQVSIYKTSDMSIQAEEVVSNCSKHFWKGEAFVVVEVPGIVFGAKNRKPRERILYRTN